MVFVDDISYVNLAEFGTVQAIEVMMPFLPAYLQ